MGNLVINLIGGPGSGKSTIAAGLFYELKKRGYLCELVTEYAKDKVWEESYKTLDDQIYVFGKQFHRMFRVKDKVDIIITDSPLPLSIIYDKGESKYFHNFVIEQYNTFNNLMVFVERETKYEEEGRMQTEAEAIVIDNHIKNLLDTNNIKYICIPTTKVVEKIVKNIERNKHSNVTEHEDTGDWC